MPYLYDLHCLRVGTVCLVGSACLGSCARAFAGWSLRDTAPTPRSTIEVLVLIALSWKQTFF